jgi:hypothetical protein
MYKVGANVELLKVALDAPTNLTLLFVVVGCVVEWSESPADRTAWAE